jgi:four helix bundle protein
MAGKFRFRCTFRGVKAVAIEGGSDWSEATANAIRQVLPSGRAALSDQLDRAAVSIAMNIAEGAGEFAAREKARFYRIARRSATECAAILDVARRLGVVGNEPVEAAKEQLRAIVAMLVALGKSKDSSGQ